MLRFIEDMTLKMMNKINVSIRIKIVVIFVLSTIIPLGVFGAISYISYFNSMQETVSKHTSEIANQLNLNLKLFFSDINKILDSGNDTLITDYLSESDPLKKYEYAKEIGVRFGLYKKFYSFETIVLDVNIIGLNGNSISDRRGVYNYGWNLSENIIFKKTIESPDAVNIIIEENADSQYLRKITSKNVLSVAKVIRRPLTKEVKGLIIVDIDRKAIEEICSIQLGNTGHFIVTDKDGGFIYYPELVGMPSKAIIEKELINRTNAQRDGYFIQNINGEKYFTVYNTLQMPGWKIIGIVKLNEIMQTAYDVKKWTIIIEIGLVFAVILLFSLITNSMTIPILELRSKMKMVESGDMDVEAKYVYDDEISDLSKGFNIMIIKIKELMRKNAMHQENLKKSEFKALQAQINPHFLYNTLDAIVWSAEANNKKEVVNIAKYLSNYFRVALSKGREWIAVRDEVLHIESYLSIQKVRYRDILEYSIDIEPKIMDYRILKLTLQPLIENALYHGLKNKRGGGQIHISGKKLDDGNLVFQVSDNGIGISANKLDDLVHEINKEEFEIDMKNSFGLKNVNQRIKLYYGNQYGLSISSEQFIGTRVDIILPIIDKKSTANDIQNKGERGRDVQNISG